MFKIKKATIDSICQAAKNTFPNEFLSLLGGNKKDKIIDELIMVPAIYGKRFTLVKTHLIPFDPRMLGSIHSHPSPNNSPSRGDLQTFSKLGEIHLIISLPFELENIAVYDSKGKPMELEVIE